MAKKTAKKADCALVWLDEYAGRKFAAMVHEARAIRTFIRAFDRWDAARRKPCTSEPEAEAIAAMQCDMAEAREAMREGRTVEAIKQARLRAALGEGA